MSIEAMNQALDALVKSKKALEVLWVSHHANRTDYAIEDIESAIKALRTAIQQAEAQQPATGEPVACATPDGLKSNWHAHHVIVNKAALQMVRNALRNDVERGLKVRGEMLAELDSATFQAYPAPSVPDDVVLKAMRYEWLRYSDLDDAAARFWPEGDVPEGDAFDAAINAAMLAASNA